MTTREGCIYLFLYHNRLEKNMLYGSISLQLQLQSTNIFKLLCIDWVPTDRKQSTFFTLQRTASFHTVTIAREVAHGTTQNFSEPNCKMSCFSRIRQCQEHILPKSIRHSKPTDTQDGNDKTLCSQILCWQSSVNLPSWLLHVFMCVALIVANIENAIVALYTYH